MSWNIAAIIRHVVRYEITLRDAKSQLLETKWQLWKIISQLWEIKSQLLDAKAQLQDKVKRSRNVVVIISYCQIVRYKVSEETKSELQDIKSKFTSYKKHKFALTRNKITIARYYDHQNMWSWKYKKQSQLRDMKLCWKILSHGYENHY